MKTEQLIREYCKKKRALLVTNNTTDRVAWKKLFSDYGVPPTNFHSAGNFDEALEVLEKNRINIILTNYEVDGETSDELLEAHYESVPDRSEAFYFIFSEKNSMAMASKLAETEVDGLLIKPYNIQDLIDTITKKLESKLSMSKEEKTYHEIRSLITLGSLDEAEIKTLKYKQQRPKSPNPHFLHGLICLERNDYPDAIKYLEEVLKHDPHHHKALTHLFEIYIQDKQYRDAYRHAQTISENYPVNPDKIPDFIRVSLATKNYSNIVSFCEMVMEIEDNLAYLKTPIAAGLALGGKYLAGLPGKENLAMAKDASVKAIELADRKLKIRATAIQNLITISYFKLARKYLDQVPTDNMTIELFFLDLQLTREESGEEKAFNNGRTLIKAKKFSPQIFNFTLDCGKSIGRPEADLKDIIHDAIKLFPDHQTLFEQTANVKL